MLELSESIGIVVIGRNEGERLQKSINSVIDQTSYIVYVDSGSIDDSVERARQSGIEIVELDPSIRFTAARAYNTGVEHLLKLKSNLQFVQFLDGDAILDNNWLKTAYKELATHPEIGVVCGRRREKSPDQTLYNFLTDLEWITPIGEVQECGPEAMMRVSSFLEVGGFNKDLIAGEEPEICYRLRQKGFKIIRLDADTSVHDVEMRYLSQWLKRCRRGGYAFAAEAWLHGLNQEHYRIKQCLSIWFWTLGMLCFTFLISLKIGLISLVILLVAYLLLLVKTYIGSRRKRRLSRKQAIIYAMFCLVGKFPELLGQIEFLGRKLVSKPRSLIEYKIIKN